MNKDHVTDKAHLATQKLSTGALLTLDEVSAMLDLSHSTIHRLPLQSIRIGRQLRYAPRDVLELIERGKVLKAA